MAQLLLSTLAAIIEQKPVQETAVLIAKTLADITGVNGSAVCLVDLPQPVGNLAGEGCTHCAIKAAPNGERAPECELVINPGIYSFPLQQEGQFYGRFQVQFDNPKTASGLTPLLALFAELLTRE